MDVMRLVDEDFFANNYKYYEDSVGYSHDEIQLIKKYFIRGMLKLYAQLSDLCEFDSLVIHIDCGGHIDKYTITVSNEFTIKSQHEDPVELKNIIDVIQYVHTLCEYIPLSYISKIVKNDEELYRI